MDIQNIHSFTKEKGIIQNNSQKKNNKKWIILSILAMFIILLYIGYTFLLGGGRLIGTWKSILGNATYEFEMFRKGERKTTISGNESTFPIHWEYDDSTKCLIIEIEAEQNPWIEVYKVEYIDDNMMQLTKCNERNGDYKEFKKQK